MLVNFMFYLRDVFLCNTAAKAVTALLLCSCFFSWAQDGTIPEKGEKQKQRNNTAILKSKGRYLLGSVSYNQVLDYANSTAISVAVPYASKDVAYTSVLMDTSRIKTSTPFKKAPNFITLNVEANLKSHLINFQYGAPVNGYSGVFFSAGYGGVMDVRVAKKKRFAIKAQLNGAYYSLVQSIENTIDNKNKYVKILGKTYEPGFAYRSSHGPAVIKPAEYVGMNYKSVGAYLMPQLSIANNRDKRLFVSLNVGWMIPVYLDDGIVFYQHGDGAAREGSLAGYSDSGIIVTSAGKRLKADPYKFMHPYLSVSVGCYLNK